MFDSILLLIIMIIFYFKYDLENNKIKKLINKNTKEIIMSTYLYK